MFDLSEQRFHSPTGLANRAVFLDRLRHAVELHRRDQQTICVILIDLDDFKQVNDNLGHDAGDKLLERVVKRLRAQRAPQRHDRPAGR